MPPILESNKILILFVICVLAFTNQSNGQDSIPKLSFTGDFRFRVEPDWDSRKSDGSFRDNRTRLRYRVRFGANYRHQSWLNFGLRIRTGIQNKQQDPQLTLGDGFNEFGTLPIGFEKIFAEFSHKGFRAWLGKNTFPFFKQNELFWSDNVYPEGVAIKYKSPTSLNWIDTIGLSGGHFISRANGKGLDEDSYFQGLQIKTEHFDQKLSLFPSFYYFKNIPNIPDGAGTFNIDYAILHLGASAQVLSKPQLQLEADYYENLKDYSRNDSIASNLQRQTQGITLSASVGRLKEAGDWKIRFTYNRQERFSAVDYFSQNDWARWDYSNFGSLDGRLTNYQGWEFMAGYQIKKGIKVNMRYFWVEQLIAYGPFLENGQRVRFDIDIAF